MRSTATHNSESQAEGESNPRETAVVSLFAPGGNYRWRVRKNFARHELLRRLAKPEQLFAPPAEPLRNDGLRRINQVVRVKPGDHSAEPLIVKRYHSKSFWDSLKNLFRPSRASQAFALTTLLNGLNISTATPVAAGERRHFGWLLDSYFISLELLDACSLREFRKKTAPGHGKKLFCELGRMMARLHNAGLSHSDPTLSNFFVRSSTQNQTEIVLIDLDAIRRALWLSRGRATKDLQHFLGRIPANARERLWFIAQYCRSRTGNWPARELAKQLSLIGAHSGQRRRPPVATLRVGSMRWKVREPFEWDMCGRVLENPEAFLRDPDQFVKNSRVVTVARVPRGGPGEASLILRRLNYGKLRHRLRDFFRHSRAQRALLCGLQLKQAGIATARALAAADVRRFRWPIAAYLVTEEIEGAQTLAQFLAGHAVIPRTLTERLATLLAQLHNAGFSHRDLKASNILVSPSLQPFLIDLDGVRRFRRMTQERAIADLARLGREFLSNPRTLQRCGSQFLRRYCREREIQNQHRDFLRKLAARLRTE